MVRRAGIALPLKGNLKRFQRTALPDFEWEKEEDKKCQKNTDQNLLAMQPNRFQSFIKERCIICYKYVLQSEYQWAAPMEYAMHKALPDFFEQLPSTGILWTSEVMDYRRTYDSRLRWIHQQMQDNIDVLQRLI